MSNNSTKGNEKKREKPEQHQREKADPKPLSRPPQPSQADQERADWEGMGQSRYAPNEQ